MSILLITHDLGVVAEVAHRVVVMYAGKVVEQGGVRDVFERPQHPYTAGLLQSIPKLDGTATRLRPIEGNVPDASRFPNGCRFHPRCRFRLPRCSDVVPVLTPRRGLHVGEVPHASACFFRDEHPAADLLDDAPTRSGRGEQ
jgi:peptide/nickel transport system ATP-binding protein